MDAVLKPKLDEFSCTGHDGCSVRCPEADAIQPACNRRRHWISFNGDDMNVIALAAFEGADIEALWTR